MAASLRRLRLQNMVGRMKQLGDDWILRSSCFFEHHARRQASVAGAQALDNFWKLLEKSMPKSLRARETEADARVVSQRLWSYAYSFQFCWNAQGDLWKEVGRLIR